MAVAANGRTGARLNDDCLDWQQLPRVKEYDSTDVAIITLPHLKIARFQSVFTFDPKTPMDKVLPHDGIREDSQNPLLEIKLQNAPLLPHFRGKMPKLPRSAESIVCSGGNGYRVVYCPTMMLMFLENSYCTECFAVKMKNGKPAIKACERLSAGFQTTLSLRCQECGHEKYFFMSPNSGGDRFSDVNVRMVLAERSAAKRSELMIIPALTLYQQKNGK